MTNRIIETIIWFTHSRPFTTIPIRILKKNSKIELQMQKLNETRSKETHKIGLVYVGKGQYKEQDILANTKGSEKYNEFIKQLGEEIELKGWKKYNGKLDTRNESDGDKAIYYCDENVEIVYHEIVKIPIKKGEQIYQQK